MKKMNRWFLALVLVLAVMLSACGGSEDVSGEITPATTPAETEPALVDTPVSLGRIEGGVYTNAYTGFGCELDSNWVFYSAEELQELPGNVQEILGETDMGEDLAEMTQIADMKAENATDLMVINVLYNQLDTQTRLLYAVMSEEDIMNALMEQKDTLITTYAQAGIEVSSMELVEVEFAGEQRLAMKTSSTWDGVPYFTLQLFDYHLGRYSVTTTLSCYLEDRTEDMLSLFFKVD